MKGDAIHLAYASFYKIDFLLTWNCNHLANANKRQHIRRINTGLNLSVPEIVTPLELFKKKTMIESALLKEKYETQKRLDEQANHDLKQYFSNAHHNVGELAEKFGLTIRYGDIKGGFLTPVHEESTTTTE